MQFIPKKKSNTKDTDEKVTTVSGSGLECLKIQTNYYAVSDGKCLWNTK